jgi:hypothetical protein
MLISSASRKRKSWVSKGERKDGRPMEKMTTDTQGKVPIQVSKKDKPNSYKEIVPEIENIPSPDSLLVSVHSYISEIASVHITNKDTDGNVIVNDIQFLPLKK